MSEIPAWDGNETGALEYFSKIERLATLGGHIPEQLGRMMAARFPAGSPIEGWWSTRSPLDQDECMADYLVMIHQISDTWLGERWVRNLRDSYEKQQFCKKGFENEEPSDFIV
jgi:hypothetical protein